ncbi:MAG: hypothetical protein ACI93H_000412, partial [Psychromonas sp.]
MERTASLFYAKGERSAERCQLMHNNDTKQALPCI